MWRRAVSMSTAPYGHTEYVVLGPFHPLELVALSVHWYERGWPPSAKNSMLGHRVTVFAEKARKVAL